MGSFWRSVKLLFNPFRIGKCGGGVTGCRLSARPCAGMLDPAGIRVDADLILTDLILTHIPTITVDD